ncbi:MAG TPA: hypothetical protein VID25_00430 [Candidatus Limnocylindrales bacterium]
MTRFVLRTLALLSVLLLLIALEASSVLATSSLGGKVRYADTVVVPATETVASDLYLFGGTVTMDGTVHGDLVAAGGNVQVGGKVDGDIIVGGGTVVLTGPVGGAIRAGAGQLTVSGDVQRDVLAGSGTLLITSGAHVGGDLIFAAGQTTLNGDVAGSIQGQASTYARSGAVGGTEDVTITPTTASVAAPAATPESVILGALRHFIVVLLFGALALWLMPRGLRAADEVVRRRPLPALGTGVVALFGYAVLIVALLVLMVVLAIAFGLLTLGSLVAVDVVTWLLATGGITLGFILAAAFIADGVVGLALGRLVLRNATVGRWQELAVLAAGAAVVVIGTSVPLIGPWIKLVVVLLGLGALAMVAWATWKGRRAAPALAGPMPPLPPVATTPA